VNRTRAKRLVFSNKKPALRKNGVECIQNSVINDNAVAAAGGLGGGIYVSNFSGEGTPITTLTNVTLDSNSAMVVRTQ
jgi:hypothetical protein